MRGIQWNGPAFLCTSTSSISFRKSQGNPKIATFARIQRLNFACSTGFDLNLNLASGSSVDIEGASASEAYDIYAHLPNHPEWSSLLSEVSWRHCNGPFL